MPTKTTRFLSRLLLILLFLGGVLFIVLGTGFNGAQSILGMLSADGTFDALTLERYKVLQIPFLLAALLLTGTGVFFLRKPHSLQTVTEKLLAILQHFPTDAKEMAAALKRILPQKSWGWILLGLILITGIFARGLLLDNSLSYDEAYTYINFVRPGLDTILLDYHVPNNHIFHSVLCWISTTLFPVTPTSLRLTAFLAGITCILLVYLLGSAVSHPVTGYLAAAAVSIWPWLVYYGKNARGYTLLTVFALLLFLALTYLKDHRNIMLWCCVPVIVSLGGWTMPTMLYPTAAIYLWFLLSALIGPKPKDYLSRWHAILALVVSGGFAILLTILLYSPVIIWGTGVDSLVDNRFLKTYPLAQLPGELAGLFRNTWSVTFRRVDFLRTPVILGWVLHLLLVWHKKKYPVPHSITMLAVLAGLLFVQRVVPYERTWVFLIPFLLLWSVEGWVALLQFIQEKAFPQKATLLNWVSVLSVGLLSIGVVRMLTEYPQQLRQIKNIPQSAQFLKEIATNRDWIVPNGPEDMPYHFYHAYYGLDAALLHPQENMDTIYVIDSTYNKSEYDLQTEVSRILESNGFDLAQVDLDNANIIQTFSESGDYYSLGNTMVIAVPISAP